MRIPRSLVALPLTLILGLTLGGPTAVADPPSPPGTKASPAGQSHRSDQAEAALAAVQELVSGHGSRGHTADGRDLTVALRDLRMLMDALPGDEKREAQRYFMRPGNGTDPYIPGALPINRCLGELCVHYAETGGNQVDGSDGNPDTIPAYVTLVIDTINQINTDYVAAGYRTPKRDGSLGGGSNKIDIYLGDIGPQGLYGFCTSDDPNDPSTTHDYSLWAYCALDNDYDPSEFPTNTPTENMQVTAAHEFFHAVQFGYDAYEDGWILESTATWAEDEMFDAVDDNRQYLADSPITMPGRSIDRFGGVYHYGVWIWWRYLTEKFPGKTGRLPNLVLAVWKRLDGTPTGPDDYSMQGLSRVLGSRGTSLKKEFQLFSAANRHPRTVYSEGSAYPSAPTGLTLGFSGAQRKGAIYSPNHLSAGTVKMRPDGLSQSDWKLKLTFDAPATARGGAFVVVVYKRGGGIATSIARLDRTGAGTKTVPFSSGSVDHVDVIFVNTSARFNCWQSNSSPYSCLGVPRDDGLKSTFVGKAFRS